ncbi:MAG: PhoU domain-containing protein, partial [Alphaproteobacteria bacterium]
MADHIVLSFDEDLKKLTNAIADMGGRAEQMVAKAMTALEKTDVDAAREAIVSDRIINTLHN